MTNAKPDFVKGDYVFVTHIMADDINWVQEMTAIAKADKRLVVLDMKAWANYGWLILCREADDPSSQWWWYPPASLGRSPLSNLVKSTNVIVGRETEDIPGYTDSVNPEVAMQVLRSLCGRGS